MSFTAKENMYKYSNQVVRVRENYDLTYSERNPVLNSGTYKYYKLEWWVSTFRRSSFVTTKVWSTYTNDFNKTHCVVNS